MSQPKETNLIKSLGFKRAVTEIAVTYVTTVDEPLCVHILPSGWTNPRQYHVIIEYGDMDQAEHALLTAEQIKEKHGIVLDDVSTPHDVSVSARMIKDRPDDAVLGAFVRQRSYAKD